MSMNDLMSDYVARVNNAVRASNPTLEVLKNRLVVATTKKLTKLGYFEGYEDGEKTIKITLGAKKINNIKRVSKPGCRVYTTYSEMPKLFGGVGFYLLSSSQGVVTNIEAKNQKTGGEILFKIF
jgi:small subunit ribosomal protein S8